MKTATFTLPMLYGDHHVLAVQQLLQPLPGIKDLYVSSSFQIVEIEYDESEITEDKIQAALAESGYLEEMAIPQEFGGSPTPENGRPFFRHTAVFAQTGSAISFGQDVPEVKRPLWPCPGMNQQAVSSDQ